MQVGRELDLCRLTTGDRLGLRQREIERQADCNKCCDRPNQQHCLQHESTSFADRPCFRDWVHHRTRYGRERGAANVRSVKIGGFADDDARRGRGHAGDVLSRPGVLHAVEVKRVQVDDDEDAVEPGADAVAVLADQWWRATKAIQDIKIVWDAGKFASGDNALPI